MCVCVSVAVTVTVCVTACMRVCVLLLLVLAWCVRRVAFQRFIANLTAKIWPSCFQVAGGAGSFILSHCNLLDVYPVFQGHILSLLPRIESEGMDG